MKILFESTYIIVHWFTFSLALCFTYTRKVYQRDLDNRKFLHFKHEYFLYLHSNYYYFFLWEKNTVTSVFQQTFSLDLKK